VLPKPHTHTPTHTHMQVLPQLGRSAIRNNMLKLANSKLNHIYDITDATD